MFSGIEESRISKRDRLVKVKYFPGATINGMYDYIKPLLKKYPVYFYMLGILTQLMSHSK